MSEDLYKIREDPFIVKTDSNSYELKPYTVDYLDDNKIAELLARAGREYIKKGLCALSPDFSNAFEKLGKLSPKAENASLLLLLDDELKKLNEIVDVEILSELAEDYIYDECFRVEKNLKKYKESHVNWQYHTEERIIVNLQENYLNKMENTDATTWINEQVSYLHSYLSLILDSFMPFYCGNLTEAQRKAEQRKRDVIFVKICQGLCFFYDLYTYKEYDRKRYSIIDILAFRSVLRDPYNRYPLTVDGLYDCFDCFIRRIDEFGYVEQLEGLEFLNINFIN